jgi:hypothetical protein
MVTVSSTTDDPAAVTAAAGVTDDKKPGDTPATEEKKETEPGKPAGDDAPGGEAGKETEPKQETGGEGSEGEQPPKKKGGFQRTIEKLERDKHELELKNAELSGKLAGKPAGEQEKTAEPDGKPVPPKAGDFDLYEKYLEAQAEYVDSLTDWKLDQRDKERAAREARERSEQEQKRLSEAWTERCDVARKAHDDFDDVIDSNTVRLTPHLQQAVMDSEKGAELAYVLAKDPEELKRLVKLGPIAVAREIGKIEAKLETKPASHAKTTPSKAPDPIKPVGSGSTKTDKPLEEMDYQDYKRARQAQLSAAHR